jgi:hypothetical protein
MRSFRPSWALEASGYRVTWEGDVISALSPRRAVTQP